MDYKEITANLITLAFFNYLEQQKLEIVVPFPPNLAKRMLVIASQVETGDADAVLPDDAL